MSAPRTNVDKQVRRHRPALWGIGVALVFGVLMMLFWLFWSVEEGGVPEGAELQLESGVGVEPVEDEDALTPPGAEPDTDADAAAPAAN